MAEEIYVDIKVNDKQLKQAVEYAEQLVGLLESPEAANQQDALNVKLNEALKTIEELKKAKTKDSETELKFGIKKLEFSKLELQKQKELLAEGKKRATAQDRQKKKEIAAAEKVAKKLEAEEALLSKQAETYEELAGQTAIPHKAAQAVEPYHRRGCRGVQPTNGRAEPEQRAAQRIRRADRKLSAQRGGL